MGKRGGRVKGLQNSLTCMGKKEDMKMREMYDMNTGHGNGWLMGRNREEWDGRGLTYTKRKELESI